MTYVFCLHYDTLRLASKPSPTCFAYLRGTILGEAGLAIANRIQGELVDAFEGLADVPGKGHKRPDLTAGLCCSSASINT